MSAHVSGRWVNTTASFRRLERSHASCLGICPRLKLALAFALDPAAGQPLDDAHVLRGMLSVPDLVAARVLAPLRISDRKGGAGRNVLRVYPAARRSGQASCSA